MAFTILETFTDSNSGSRDDENKVTITATRQFNLASDTTATSLSARSALAIGEGVIEGASHPEFPFYFCNGVSINRISPIYFEATATYQSVPYREDENPGGDPTAERAKIRYGTSSEQLNIDSTVDDPPVRIQTEADEPYQGITATFSNLTITLQKKYSIFRPYEFYEFIDTVNDSTFLGFTAGTLKINNIEAQQVTLNEREYWDVTVQILARKPLADTTNEQAWYLRLCHEGFYYINTGGDIVRARDEEQEPVTQPILLNDTGGKLTAGSDPIFKYFKIYESTNFSDMNFGV